MSEIIKENIMCRVEMKTSPTTAPIHRVNETSDLVKTLTMTIWTGDLWMYNPTAHIYIMVDGYIRPGDPRTSLQGRGITLGDTPSGFGIGFEHFGEKPFMVGEYKITKFLPYEFYDVSVRCSKTLVSYEISGKNGRFVSSHRFSKDYPSNDSIVGTANDQKSSQHGFFNMRQQFRLD